MGLFTLLLIVVVILALIGLGWKTFSSGVISGFETVLDVSLKNLTQEAKEYANNPILLASASGAQ